MKTVEDYKVAIACAICFPLGIFSFVVPMIWFIRDNSYLYNSYLKYGLIALGSLPIIVGLLILTYWIFPYKQKVNQ